MARPVALVTGGARGIGLGIAQDLASDHDVFVTHLTTPASDLPTGVSAIRADFEDDTAAAAVVDEVIAKAGRLDSIVHNAGALAASPFEGTDVGARDAMFRVNLFAAQDLLVAALPHLNAGAAMVAISSVNAVLPPRGAALYGASKAALELWVRGAAKELGPRGVRVNAVAPGAIETADKPRSDDLQALFIQDTALGRLGTPEDVARAVRFLLSDAAGFITGNVLTVSGGYRL